jgi:hypothetical protein
LAKPEALCFRVPVVKLERRDAPVIPADDTTPSGFRDENLLYAPATGGNRDDAASAATVRPIAIHDELRESVRLAETIELVPTRPTA